MLSSSSYRGHSVAGVPLRVYEKMEKELKRVHQQEQQVSDHEMIGVPQKRINL